MSDLAWAHVVRASDRAVFKRCRREWDLSSRSRRNLEPVIPPRRVDLDRAVHDALAVYYFPGMWEWDRGIVQPLALEAFSKSMRTQRDARGASGPLEPETEAEWATRVDHGVAMLNEYFDWAPTMDRFTPVRVETDFEIDIPDPTHPDANLTTADGLAVRFRGRIDMIIVDPDDVYWLVDHRFTHDDWTDLDLLMLDEAGVSACWAWEKFFIGMRVAGVIYNELRLPGNADAERSPASQKGPAVAPSPGSPTGHRRMYVQPARAPDPRIDRFGTESSRRTRIPRSRAELDQAGAQLAAEALDMTDSVVALYPHPTRTNCGNCAYRRPCIAINWGQDPSAILAADYRIRGPETEEGRLGGVTWSMNRGAAPPRFGSDRAGR